MPQGRSVCGTNTDTTRYESLSYEFEERAAIMEYDGGLSQEEAERLARVDWEENQRTS